MSAGIDDGATVGVVGAGAMGCGIALVAASHGHPVYLLDAAAGAAERGYERIEAGLGRRVGAGRLDPTLAASTLERIVVAASVDDLSAAELVVEAIIEDADAKIDVLRAVEGAVSPRALITTNTSSLSITRLAAALEHPGRFAGFHFFNPAPVMSLVEVVAGLATERATAERLAATAHDWGKVPVHARSTPGFIVNRVARPFYGEALALLEEGIAPEALDALFRGAGFRMGPCELMDLIGHDVNFAVTCSVHAATYGDPRYRPSIVQRELVDAGWLGVKSGRGFYDHRDATAVDEPAWASIGPDVEPFPPLEWDVGSFDAGGVVIQRTDGLPAGEHEKVTGVPHLVHDLRLPSAAGGLGFAASGGVPEEVVERFVATAGSVGLRALQLPDVPGLVVARTVAMIVNEAHDAVHLRVAAEHDVDLAMTRGVNYPEGPIAWGRLLGARWLTVVLDNLARYTGDPRYRVSQRLRRDAPARPLHGSSRTSGGDGELTK